MRVFANLAWLGWSVLMVSPISIGVTSTSFQAQPELKEYLQHICPTAVIEYMELNSPTIHDLKMFLRDKSVWLVGKESVSKELLASLPHLKLVAKYGVGLDNIDFEACHGQQIEVRHAPGVNARAVAEFTLGLIISLRRNIGKCSRLLSQGIWRKNGGFSLFESTIGIVGFGHVGSKVGELLDVLGARVLVYDIIDKSHEFQHLNIEFVDLDTLVQQVDLLTLHVPLTPRTHHLIDLDRLMSMKRGAQIVNTSRGAVVCSDSLKRALNDEHLSSAASDVFTREPLNDSELYLKTDFLATPHIAGNSRGAVMAMGKGTVEIIGDYLSQKI